MNQGFGVQRQVLPGDAHASGGAVTSAPAASGSTAAALWVADVNCTSAYASAGHFFVKSSSVPGVLSALPCSCSAWNAVLHANSLHVVPFT